MQDKQEKILHFKNTVAHVIKNLRNEIEVSGNKFANEYDLDSGSLSRIEKGQRDPQFTTMWKTIEALGIKFSEFAKLLEDELGEDFTFIDE